VDLGLSDDQELLRVTTERFIESSYPLGAVRALADSDAAGVDREYLRRGAELGWFAMLVPEEHGGGSVSGAGLLDAVVLAEERGKYLQPGPFVPNNVVAYAIAAPRSSCTVPLTLPPRTSVRSTHRRSPAFTVSPEVASFEIGSGAT